MAFVDTIAVVVIIVVVAVVSVTRVASGSAAGWERACAWIETVRRQLSVPRSSITAHISPTRSPASSVPSTHQKISRREDE